MKTINNSRIISEIKKIETLASELAIMCEKHVEFREGEPAKYHAWLRHENSANAHEYEIDGKRLRIKNDLTGKVFGHLTVLHPTTPERRPDGRTRTMYMCKCDCGAIKAIRAEALTRGKATSCGCKMGLKLDIVGEQYGDLMVMSEAETLIGKSGLKTRQWLCKCKCGEYLVVKQPELRRGEVTCCEKCEEAKLPNLTGRVFGKWKVICKAEPIVVNDSRGYHNTVRAWTCQCECGTVRSVKEGNLLSGMSTSCGCKRTKTGPQKSWKGIDLTEMVFGKWTVLEKAKPITYTPDHVSYSSYQIPRWICKCDCGTVRAVNQTNLVNGVSTSCGCKGVETRMAKYRNKNSIAVPADIVDAYREHHSDHSSKNHENI